MSKESYMDQMIKRIDLAKSESAFVVSDFTDLMDYETAKKSLLRLEKAGKIRKLFRGLYDKPLYSEMLQEYSAPNPEEIATALARNLNWTIAPSGMTALNLLGLSTQVPAQWTYITNGPYKEYTIGKITIKFVHRANREITGMSKITAITIQALKAIGEDKLDTLTIQKIRRRLEQEDLKRLLSEARRTTVWIYDAIKKICEYPDREQLRNSKRESVLA